MAVAVCSCFLFTFGCSQDKKDVIPDASDVASVKIAVSALCMNDDDYDGVENQELYDSSRMPIIRFDIDDEDVIAKAVETNKAIDSAENLSDIDSPDFRYKCEYTMKDGTKIYNSIQKTVLDEDALFGDFIEEINKYAVKSLSSASFGNDEWVNE